MRAALLLKKVRIKRYTKSEAREEEMMGRGEFGLVSKRAVDGRSAADTEERL